ncbi:MAG: BamA/TamA family outer membrane protein [candidate division KSB1 bacterium]|nr:BamA/TamA family outer membrane protein [candidate division KSB1 bacterium]MDZ7276044.1 BamA/TamA family outer membrane protein [candidate division KSB1 bacterium]MDZ7285674.1 BamA/TamA family outer membrane protein [candidate division KSB1 bacterium]MDZ7298706.1 BamA/TamA family outer membrane protein [candidate division KSB1 bacterium]MDZ7307545.1 BamA/TamA family outer membrane protein [candidate division KSB1 bacterium]
MPRQLAMQLLLISLSAWECETNGQQSSANENATQAAKSEVRVPGARYVRGGLHRFFFGAHYRDVWAAPVTVAVLDLADFAGGLTPSKKGGGLQTKSLRFNSGDGREFAFRSLDKDPGKTLPPELQETVAADIIQDQISSAHPYAALVVPAIAEAVGVLHANPLLVIMPDDPRLGEFRQEFGGLLGMIEERPADGPDGERGFAGAKKIVGSDDLFAELQEDNDDAVDQRAYLRARLLDIFLGDWDRHPDQWRWARFSEGNNKIWLPIPRDRDQAFAKFDGLLPAFAERRDVVKQLENFAKSKPDIVSLTHSGRHTDRKFLNRLAWPDFQQVTQAFVAGLTDSVLAYAVKQLPPAVYEINGPELEQRLKQRRNHMPEAARQYYRLLAEHVEIKMSDKPEYAELDRSARDQLTIKIFKFDEAAGKRSDDLLFQRTFHRAETKEVRLFLMGGRDKAVARGRADTGITVRLIGGAGEDEFVNEDGGRIFIYDAAGTTRISGTGMRMRLGAVDSLVNRHADKPARPDYGSEARSIPFLAYTPDDGLLFGHGQAWYRYAFRKQPHAWKMTLRGNLAFATGAFRLRYTADIVDVFKHVRFGLEAGATVPREARNFHGFGNHSSRTVARAGTTNLSGYYRVRMHEYWLRPSLRFDLLPHLHVSLAGAVKYTDTAAQENTFVRQTRPYGVAINGLAELSSGLELELRDQPVATSRGLYASSRVAYVPAVFDNPRAFTKGAAELRLYYSPVKRLTLATRGAGEKIWGRAYPYYEAAFAGGNVSLRGFRRERFAGDAAAIGNAELRAHLVRTKVVFPMDFGLFVFGDAGRVWFESQSPGGWHTSLGGGLWLAPIYRRFTFSIGVGSSAEGKQLTAGGGFMF